MIPYYSPNFRIKDFIASLFVKDADAKLIAFFKGYTGKQYVLITPSCRSALYLTYQALNKEGGVYTSPLSCKVAIDPIVNAGRIVHYGDVKTQSLVLDVSNTIDSRGIAAFQVIHLGGQMVDVRQVREWCDLYSCLMVEDCAQGFYSETSGLSLGRLADVACFSLIKNAYGIGGGILATDVKALYEQASKQVGLDGKHSRILIGYRIVRNLLESYRTTFLGAFLYATLIKLRGDSREGTEVYGKELRAIEKKIAVHQLMRSRRLNERRRKNAEHLIPLLEDQGVTVLKAAHHEVSSYTKLYIYHPHFNSERDIEYLNNIGIEAKHLEQKIGSFYQERFCDLPLDNYNLIHDKIISIPLFEYMKKRHMKKLVDSISKLINNENIN